MCVLNHKDPEIIAEMYFMMLECFDIRFHTYVAMQITIAMNPQQVWGIDLNEFAVCSLKPCMYMGKLHLVTESVFEMFEIFRILSL